MTKKSASPAADDAPMTPERFRAWRKRLGLKQRDAAERLGLKKRMIQYYEKGRRDGKDVTIPKTVRLACYAVSAGIGDFDGETVRPAPVASADASPAPAPPEESAPPADAAEVFG